MIEWMDGGVLVGMAVASTRVINKVEEYVDTRIYEIALYLEAPRIHEDISKQPCKKISSNWARGLQAWASQ
jgi:hypothetical protein